MKLKIDGKQNNPILPRAVEPLLADADASDLRVLIYAALRTADGADFEAKDAAAALALSESEVRSSVKFWRGAGLLAAQRRKRRRQRKRRSRMRRTPQRKPRRTRTSRCATSARCA